MLNIDPWNMVMIVINLLVLYAIFRKFLYKPVMNVIHQREELIQGQFDSAKKTQDDALALKVRSGKCKSRSDHSCSKRPGKRRA